MGLLENVLKSKSATARERFIQAALFVYFDERYSLVVPNLNLPSGEADVVAFDRKGYLTEFEIKLSRADFLREQQAKRAKHQRIQKTAMDSAAGLLPPKKIARHFIPNYMVFVVPAGLVQPQEMPTYYGLLELSLSGTSKKSRPVVRASKRKTLLHEFPPPAKLHESALQAIHHRYWNLLIEGRRPKLR